MKIARKRKATGGSAGSGSRWLGGICALGIAAAVLFCGEAEASRAAAFRDYSRLVDYIRLEDRTAPLLVLQEKKGEPDPVRHMENIAYFNNSPDLIGKIEARLESEELRWRLGSATQRLLFVPERRRAYAELYESYCLDAVDLVLKKMGIDSPYRAIVTLSDEDGVPGPPARGEGVTALLVHNAADEYVEDYVFSEPGGKSVRIRLRNREFIGKGGAFSSHGTFDADGVLTFEEDRFTLWRNSATHPIQALAVPVEETLHIALRAATEEAIRDGLSRRKRPESDTARRVAEDWIAVEEAIVGGLVFSVLPEIFERHFPEAGTISRERFLRGRRSYPRYRHLEKGIRLVKAMGWKKALGLYRTDPAAFRKLLME